MAVAGTPPGEGSVSRTKVRSPPFVLDRVTPPGEGSLPSPTIRHIALNIKKEYRLAAGVSQERKAPRADHGLQTPQERKAPCADHGLIQLHPLGEYTPLKPRPCLGGVL